MSTSSENPHATFKFPAFQPDLLPTYEEEEPPFAFSSSRRGSPSPHRALQNGTPTGTAAHGILNGSVLPSDRWQPRRSSRANSRVEFADRYSGAGGGPTTRHGRQKSLSEAIRTIRTRKGSVSQNAVEIADALKAPVSWRLIALCGAWYMSSISSNTSSKAILSAFPYPLTLTIIQFAFISTSCLFLAALARKFPRLKTTIPVLKFGIRHPSRELIMTTLPLAFFQLFGHWLSSTATKRIPVSIVHTVKGLSPLMTVAAYRIFYKIRYSVPTYLSLIPLTVGVALACSADFNADVLGVTMAFASAVLFVTQNIVSKKIFNEAAATEREGLPPTRYTKPDKLNLLCYSSGMAFVLTVPLWVWREGFGLISEILANWSLPLAQQQSHDPTALLDHRRLTLEFIFNGIVHFGQNIVAFVLLSMVSPVTYSVASLIKRVFVICFAIVWYKKPMTNMQAAGFGLTFLGLYLYDRTSESEKADRRAKALGASSRLRTILPTTREKGIVESPGGMGMGMGMGTYPLVNGGMHGSEVGGVGSGGGGKGNGYAEQRDSKKSDGELPAKNAAAGWLPPGTRAEDTWLAGEKRKEGTAGSHHSHQSVGVYS